MIGLEEDELECTRVLLRLLRHPDPVVAELTRQALAYLSLVAERSPLSDIGRAEQISYIQ